MVWFEPGEGGDGDAVLAELARVLTAEGVIATLRPGAGADEFEPPSRQALAPREAASSAQLARVERRTAEPLEQVQVRGEPRRRARGTRVALASASELPPTRARRWRRSRASPTCAAGSSTRTSSNVPSMSSACRSSELATMERERAELRARLIEAEARVARALQSRWSSRSAGDEPGAGRPPAAARDERADPPRRDGVAELEAHQAVEKLKHGLRSRLRLTRAPP